MEIINIESWNRKEHFEFFSRMASPYFGITTEVDCTIAYDNAKENGNSFFAHYLHKSMIAVNSVEELRLRIVDNKVALFEKINAGATVGRADGTFGFIFVNFSDDSETFNKELQNALEEEKMRKQSTQFIRVPILTSPIGASYILDKYEESIIPESYIKSILENL